MQFNISEIQHIPHNSGIYKYYDKNNNLLYIGKAKNLFKRVSSYFNNKILPDRTLKMIEQISFIVISITASETEALILENHSIRSEKPKYNIIFKDDKSYPYLRISNHAYPRLTYFRGKNIDNSTIFGPYPNAYSLKDNIQMLQKIFKLRTCEDTSFKNRSKPCMLFQIKRCSAPCVDFISQQEYKNDVEKTIAFLNGNYKKLFVDLENKMQSFANELNYEQAAQVRDQIKSLSELFKQQNIDIGKNINIDVIAVVHEFNKLCLSIGIIRNGKHLGYKYIIQNIAENLIIEDSNTLNLVEFILISYIQQQVDYIHAKSSINNLYILNQELSESAWENIHEFMPNIKPYKTQNNYTKSWLQDAKNNAEMHLKQFFNNQNNTKQQINSLCELLKLNTINPHIECFDISHTSGDFTKASCVVFKDTNFDRKSFRHYNIKLEVKSDDYEAMRQAVFKRYKNIEVENLPHIILIDGGIGQVNIVADVFKQLSLPIKNILGISKGEKRKVGLETLIFADNREPIIPSLNNLGLILLTKIRDTAHNYAVLNMQKVRAKQQFTSSIDDIEGIGSVKKKRLIAHFGGMQGIKEATIDELKSINGINQELAERIYAYFH